MGICLEPNQYLEHFGACDLIYPTLLVAGGGCTRQTRARSSLPKCPRESFHAFPGQTGGVLGVWSLEPHPLVPIWFSGPERLVCPQKPILRTVWGSMWRTPGPAVTLTSSPSQSTICNWFPPLVHIIPSAPMHLLRSTGDAFVRLKVAYDTMSRPDRASTYRRRAAQAEASRCPSV